MYTADASVYRRGAPRGYRSGCSTNAAIRTCVAVVEDLVTPPLVDFVRRQVGDAAVPVLVVVPVEEHLPEGHRVIDVRELSRE